MTQAHGIKFGLSDTAPITSNRYAGVTHYGIGIAPDANNRIRITGNVALLVILM